MTSCPLLTDIITRAAKRFARQDLDSPVLCAQLLVGHVLGLDRAGLFVQAQKRLTPAQCQAVETLVVRREQGEPLAYILGKKEFYGRDFLVSKAVLIPRPETEHCIEWALELCSAKDRLFFADLGTGSGCLAVTFALEHPGACGVALDRSSKAATIAQHNATRHAVADRVCVLNADFSLPFCPPATCDLIVSNPPYVSAQEYTSLSREITDFEPIAALVPEHNATVLKKHTTKKRADKPPATAPASGLEAIESLLPVAWHALKTGAFLVMETGAEQAHYVQQLLTDPAVSTPLYHFSRASVHTDLAGQPRILVAQK